MNRTSPGYFSRVHQIGFLFLTVLFAVLWSRQVCAADPPIKLTASDAENYDGMGSRVAIFGNIGIAGAQGEDSNGTSAGAAYVFNAVNGQQIRKLVAGDGYDRFGSAVAVYYNEVISYAVVGAADADVNAGAAYVFDLNTQGASFSN